MRNFYSLLFGCAMVFAGLAAHAQGGASAPSVGSDLAPIEGTSDLMLRDDGEDLAPTEPEDDLATVEGSDDLALDTLRK